MYIKNLKLRSFRNYQDVHLEFVNGYNIIYGNNAQGKTNIIEAIFLCAAGRSHRTSKDQEMVKTSEPGYYVRLDLHKDENEYLIEMIYEKNERKRIKINEIPMKKVGNLMGHLNAVIFSPEDLLIVKEGPSERRRFLDITLSQIRPSYFYDLQQYIKILIQRNILLKELAYKRELGDTLDVWNNHLIKTGSRIMKNRKDILEKLNQYAQIRHGQLTNGEEKLKIKYDPSFINTESEIEGIEKIYRKAIDLTIDKEISKGTTLIGPHRDDYDIILNGMSTKQFGSQGQQRTAVLAIKLAEIDIMKDNTNDYPVLLLDDVLSELDNKRQKYLFENIGNIQTFITCTDKTFFGKSEVQAKYFNIVNGNSV